MLKENKWKIFAIFRSVEISLRLLSTKALSKKEEEKESLKRQLCSISFLMWNEANFRCKWHFTIFPTFFPLKIYVLFYIEIGLISLWWVVQCQWIISNNFFNTHTHTMIFNIFTTILENLSFSLSLILDWWPENLNSFE